MKLFLSVITSLTLAVPALAEELITHDFDGSFDDATFSVEGAIVGQGLVVDYISHVGEMLNRTGADVGATKEIFKSADIFLFCSAVISRKVMEIDPMNIAHCPYSVFVIEDESGVKIGHRAYPDGPMKDVQALLDGIVREAVE